MRSASGGTPQTPFKARTNDYQGAPNRRPWTCPHLKATRQAITAEPCWRLPWAARELQLDATELRKQLACRSARRAVAILRAGLLALELLGEHCRSGLLAHELLCGAFGKRNHAVDSRGTTLEHVKQLVGSGRNGFIARIRRNGSPPMRLLRLW